VKLRLWRRRPLPEVRIRIGDQVLVLGRADLLYLMSFYSGAVEPDGWADLTDGLNLMNVESGAGYVVRQRLHFEVRCPR
jgi:hypothetical protein